MDGLNSDTVVLLQPPAETNCDKCGQVVRRWRPRSVAPEPGAIPFMMLERPGAEPLRICVDCIAAQFGLTFQEKK